VEGAGLEQGDSHEPANEDGKAVKNITPQPAVMGAVNELLQV
jgi:hypothetical protein